MTTSNDVFEAFKAVIKARGGKFMPGAFTPLTACAAVALNQAAGRSRFGTQAQVALACYLTGDGMAHDRLMKVLSLKNTDTRSNVYHELGPCQPGEGLPFKKSRQQPTRVLAETTAAPKGKIQVKPTATGIKVIQRYLSALDDQPTWGTVAPVDGLGQVGGDMPVQAPTVTTEAVTEAVS